MQLFFKSTIYQKENHWYSLSLKKENFGIFFTSIPHLIPFTWVLGFCIKHNNMFSGNWKLENVYPTLNSAKMVAAWIADITTILSLRWFLRKKKVIAQFFLVTFFKCSLPMPVSKYTNMKKISHLTCLRDMMGQTCPIRAFASTYHARHFIVSQYIFMLAGSKGFLGNTWKKLDTLGRNFKEKITISNDIDSKRSSPHCFQDLNLHPWV